MAPLPATSCADLPVGAPSPAADAVADTRYTKSRVLRRLFPMKIFSLVTAVLLAAALCGCHDLPYPDDDDDGETSDNVTINLDFTTDLPLYNAEAQAAKNRAIDSYQVRYVVKIYNAEIDARSAFTRDESAAYSSVFYRSLSEGLSTSVSVYVPEGTYTIMVWTDYIPTNTNNAPFYNADDFTEITLNTDNYIGGTDYRDAYCGMQTLTVPTQNPDSNVTVDVAMTRPLAKFELITTDVEQFMQRVGTTNISTYRVRLVYTGYLPSSFNMFTAQPIDSTLGVWFASAISTLDGGTEALLASDYVFVNGNESAVSAAVQIVDAAGTVLSQSQSVRIPIARGKLTEMRGNFLTTENSSGFSINTQFSGEYNLEF
jgi:hypothetical protein